MIDRPRNKRLAGIFENCNSHHCCWHVAFPGTHLVLRVWRYPHRLMKVQTLNGRCYSAMFPLEPLSLWASCSSISQFPSPSSGVKSILVHPPKGQYWCGLIKGSLGLSRTSLDSFVLEPQHRKASHLDLRNSSDGKIHLNFWKFFQ